jgi:hypothetical protein
MKHELTPGIAARFAEPRSAMSPANIRTSSIM